MAAGDVTQGRRLLEQKEGKRFPSMHPGDYYKGLRGEWWIRPPVGDSGMLEVHDITEHEDGTITVSPSILTDQWHGYLEHGVWREV